MNNIELKRCAKLFVIAVFAALFVCVCAFAACADVYGSFNYNLVEPDDGETFEPYVVITQYKRDDTEQSFVVDVPEDIDGTPVKEIAGSAFAGTEIKAVVLPDTIEEIGNGAFAGCASLTVFKAPAELREIGASAFQGCSALEYVELNDKLEMISELAFKDCAALSALTLGSSVAYAENGAFYNCPALTDICLPASLTHIGSLAFGARDDGDGAAWCDGVGFYSDGNTALSGYIAAASEHMGSAFAGSAGTEAPDADHDLEWVLVYPATDVHPGLEVARCANCGQAFSRDNTEIPPKSTDVAGLVSLAIGLLLAAAVVIVIVGYVRRSRARRAAAIEAYKKENGDKAENGGD